MSCLTWDPMGEIQGGPIILLPTVPVLLAHWQQFLNNNFQPKTIWQPECLINEAKTEPKRSTNSGLVKDLIMPFHLPQTCQEKILTAFTPVFIPCVHINSLLAK